MPIALNPGFVLLLAAPLTLALPRGLRPPAIAVAALAALWLVLGRDFGVAGFIRQMGVEMATLQLDALNQVFGIALLITLVLIGAYTSGRQNRFEDAAILTLAGGAVSALFAGDHLILFVAAASLAGLGATWVVFASPHPDAPRAGVRFLVWHGLESLFFLVGAALHLVQHGEAIEVRVDTGSLSGGFIFAALMIRVGAPLAHVWLKDAVSRASPAGAAALSAFTAMLGVYALARFFPAEPMLMPVGAAMIAIGAFYAVAEDDLRSAASYAQIANIGLCLALIGIGSRLSLAAVEGHAFTIIIVFSALQMSLGCVVQIWGGARASILAGVGRVAPIACACLIVAGLAVAGAPGFAMYPTLTAALAAAAQWETRWLWLMFSGLSAVLFAALVLRPALLLYRAGATPPPIANAAYGMLLGSVLGAFFCIAIGLAPQWLFSLTPSELTMSPFAPDRLARQIELLGAAGAAFLAMYAVRLFPRERQTNLLDLDTLYRGPVAGAGRWIGIVALRIFGAGQRGIDLLSNTLGQAAGVVMRQLDHPYRVRLAAAAELAALAGLVLVAALAGRS
ncbi:MAG: proton-conducting transporter membrane subunit [Terricaulis sp.]